jgi:hypothetical protein
LINLLFSSIEPASYAQACILLDKRNRSDSDKSHGAFSNMPFLYRLSPYHTLSIQHLRHALQLIINKHQALRTSLIFNAKNNLLMQRINHPNDNNTHQLFTFIESTFETDQQLNNIMQDEQNNSQHFDLTQGLVFRCHIAYYKQISTNHLLSHQDAIIFNFHDALFDFPSMDVFINDLSQAYETGQLIFDKDTIVRYLDCKYKYLTYIIPIISDLSHFLFRCYN